MAKNSQAIRFILKRYLAFSLFTRKKHREQTSSALAGVFIPVIGISIGVFCFIVVLSIMGGFVAQFKNKILGMESHIEILVKDSFGMIPADRTLIDRVKNLSPEIEGVSPFLKGDAILRGHSKASLVILVGVDPDLASTSSDMEKFLGEENLGLLKEEMPVANSYPIVQFPTVILGEELLEQVLRAGLGDRLTLMSRTAEDGPGGLAPKQLPVVVADALRSGHVSFDSKWAITSLETASILLGTPDEWAGLQVKIKDPFYADDVAKKLNSSLSHAHSWNDAIPKAGLRAKPWTESNRALLKALALERWGMSFVLLMVITVGCFSITITLVLAAKRKSREMAIFRALGFDKRALGKLFLFQGALLGVIGVSCGVILGSITLYFIKRFPIPLISPSYSNLPLPVVTNWNEVIVLCAASVMLAMIASVWPAIEVMKVDVVETLSERN